MNELIDAFGSNIKKNKPNVTWNRNKKFSSDEILKNLAVLYSKGSTNNSIKVQELIDQYFKCLKSTQKLDEDDFLNFAEIYLTPNLKKVFDGYGLNFSEYLSQAMKIYVEEKRKDNGIE